MVLIFYLFSAICGASVDKSAFLLTDGISYKTVHHLLSHFYDGRWPKQFKSSIKQDRPTVFS
jgi:hypothetical protein